MTSHQTPPGMIDARAAEPDGSRDDAVGRTLVRDRRDLGLVEDRIDLGEPYYLVDTRHWTFGTKRLVPCRAVRPGDDGDTAVITLDDETIRAAPDFDPFQLGASRYRDDLVEYYRRAVAS